MRIVVTGTGNKLALGHMIASLLSTRKNNVVGLGLSTTGKEAYSQVICDLRNYEELQSVLPTVRNNLYEQPIDCLINCAGVNKIGMLEDFAVEDFDNVMNVNARSIFYTAKAFLPQLIQTKGTILNVVSNASHKPMTGSLAYNASKGAAHIMTLQMAHELTPRHGITVLGISPNKLAGTGMSNDIDQQVCKTRGWTHEEMRLYQLKGLLSGEETDPQEVAEFVAYLLQSPKKHKYMTGCIIPFGA